MFNSKSSFFNKCKIIILNDQEALLYNLNQQYFFFLLVHLKTFGILIP